MALILKEFSFGRGVAGIFTKVNNLGYQKSLKKVSWMIVLVSMMSTSERVFLWSK